ncbi:Pentatricopeptide repeat-containing protein [Teratosphaeria destructans]|uniref:Pentatricopeptide repeat-containing protein n=1 Tax=Teratosphaeria destructans TaxID=418781 RepID=A0A9W7SM69_9PEZI|nr:Pentatricopeptide repeat-containing protein [Teratosphaeria destructans]
MKHENDIYDQLEALQDRSPFLLRSFLRFEDHNFMECMAGGTLEARIQRHQVRDPATGIISVTSYEPTDLVLRWIAQVADAAAWLESKLNLAHGDIRPSNILLDGHDNVRLADFNNTVRIGQPLEVGGPPYARFQGGEAGDESGTHGFAGARTEQFAIGTVLYSLTRGHEPFANELGDEQGPEVVARLQAMNFPDLDKNDLTDQIIANCWYARFASVQEVAVATRQVQREPYVVCQAPDEAYLTRQAQCVDSRNQCVELIEKDISSITYF